MREGEGDLVGDAAGELDVLLAVAPLLRRVEGEGADDLPLEADRDAQARAEAGAEEDRPPGGVGRQVGLGVRHDLEVELHLRPLGLGDRIGLGGPRAVARDGPEPVLGPVVGEEAEGHLVVGEDAPGDRGDLVEDLPHVEGAREGGAEGLELAVPPEPLPLLVGEALVLEGRGEDVGDGARGLLVVRAETATASGDENQRLPSGTSAADDRRDEDRARPGVERVPVGPAGTGRGRRGASSIRRGAVPEGQRRSEISLLS